MRVTFDDAYQAIAGRSASARGWVNWWRSKPAFRSVVPFVENFVHEHLFTISLSTVESVLEQSAHALGDIEKREQMSEVEDLQLPAMAVQDLFHNYIESRLALPTWGNFREYLLEPDIAPLFIKPMWDKLQLALPASYNRVAVKRALHWRIGKMYYSVMREVDFMVRLRERHGIQLKYHLLADVRLKSDFWLDDSIVSIFLANSRYRAKTSGRKQTAKDFLEDAKPPFSFVDVEFENQFERGKLYRIDEATIDGVATQILQGRSA